MTTDLSVPLSSFSPFEGDPNKFKQWIKEVEKIQYHIRETGLRNPHARIYHK